MHMTRIAYISLSVVMLALNGAAYLALSDIEQGVSPIVKTALVVNALAWPLALVIAYRIGQVTGIAYLRRRRARKLRSKSVGAQHSV